MQKDSGPGPTGGLQAIGDEAESVYEIIVREMEDAVFY